MVDMADGLSRPDPLADLPKDRDERILVLAHRLYRNAVESQRLAQELQCLAWEIRRFTSVDQ